jgi:hypothetical protein
MTALPQPTLGEITDALRTALASDGPTIREMLRALWWITHAVHPRPASYRQHLPNFEAP